ncbi:hypothetical protein Y5S_03098 [Alcanivorax nanhaiticus]|uniref:Uncharacterized protein n=2 Tax=Alcanivorax nanhaiticus TaxID=1177154 RepID=A0A095UMD7_9GAMM|nr:hypothetical protein Y5S_03098 [Alcanivorax nanhaiticus]
MSKILTLSKLRPDTALENLNRLTGLDFQQWPESLLDAPVSCGTETQKTAKPAKHAAGQADEKQYCQQG